MNIYNYFGRNPLFIVTDEHTVSSDFTLGKYEQEPNDGTTKSAFGPLVRIKIVEGGSSFEVMTSFIENSMLETREDICDKRDSLRKKETESVIRYSSKKCIEEINELIEKNKSSYSMKLLGTREDLTEYKNEDIEKIVFNSLPNSIKYLLILGNKNSDNIGASHLSRTKEGLEITTIFNKDYVSKYVFAIEE